MTTQKFRFVINNVCVDLKPEEVLLETKNALPSGQTVPVPITEKTVGLISMRERITSLGGTFSAGVVGNDWQISCRVPRHG